MILVFLSAFCMKVNLVISISEFLVDAMSCCPDGSLLIVGDKKGILYIIDTDIKEIVFSFVSIKHTFSF